MSDGNTRDTKHRFEDVIDEPCVILAPVDGFSGKPLVTLEEAVAPLKGIVPDVDRKVFFAKQRAVKHTKNLPVDQSAAIAIYTMEWEPYTDSLYYILNNTLRTEDRQQLKPWFLYLKLIVTALSHLPSISLKVYRGVRSEIKGGYAEYQIREDIIWWGFSSCSKSRNISEKGQFLGEAGTRTLFIIESINGRDISDHSYYGREKEVLLCSGATVRVTKREFSQDGVLLIRLTEEASPYNLLGLSSTEGESIESPSASAQQPVSSAIPPVYPDSPDRYFNTNLSKDIARLKPYTEGYFIGKRLNDNDVEMIAREVVLGKQCRSLFLRESAVTSRGVTFIAETLLHQNVLETLFMAHNNIGDLGVKALAKSLKSNVTLKQLNLGFNDITDEGIEHLANALESNKSLTHLWLPSNKITDRGLRRLGEVLTNTNKTLQVLSLEWNKFSSDSSVDILVSMLNSNKTLTALNLNSCALPRSAADQLKKVSKKKKHFDLTIH